MPIFDNLRKLVCCAAREQYEPEAPVRRPAPEHVATETGEPGRPYQDYVEDEARKYWQEMVKTGGLKKPDQREIRTAAMPVLGRALRRRQGKIPDPALAFDRAHQGVNALQQHTAERGWIRYPFTPSEASPDYVEALMRLADDAGWLYREIPLPEHPEPHHPPIHYTIDPVSKLPVATEDSLIRSDYVYDPMVGSPISRADYIPPWRVPGVLPKMGDLTSRGWDACYAFLTSRSGSWDRPWDPQSEKTFITYFWIDPSNPPSFRRRIDRAAHSKLTFTDFVLKGIHFSLHPPTQESIISYRRMVDLLLPPDT